MTCVAAVSAASRRVRSSFGSREILSFLTRCQVTVAVVTASECGQLGNYFSAEKLDARGKESAEEKMVSRLVPESSAVQGALERLKELEREPREDGELPAEGIAHLTAIAKALSELEATRRATRESLEVETTVNSQLRQQLKNLCDRMNEAIEADRAAARASNAGEIEQLRMDMSSSSYTLQTSEEKLQELLEQNRGLQAERERMRADNKAAIASLNHQLSLKFSRQLQLEQKLEETEELRSSITAVEQQKASLLQSMAQERQTFSEDKEKLDSKVGETVKKIKQRRRAINRSREELEKVKVKKKATDGRLGELSAQVAQLESSLERSRTSRRSCQHQLEQEARESQELSRRLEERRRDLQEQMDAFDLAIQNLQEEIKAVELQAEEGRASGLLLKKSLVSITEVFRHRQEEEKEVRADHLRVSLRLERSGLQLRERMASVFKHKKEITEMERLNQELQEEDRINKRMSESKKYELQSDLEALNSDINRQEEEIQELGLLLEQEKVEQVEYKAKMTSDICDHRRRYEALLQEEAALLQLHPENADPDLLMEQIARSEEEQERTLRLHQQEVQLIAMETEKIHEKNREKQREMEEREEMLRQVEAKWSEMKSRQEELTALHCELRDRRFTLEQSIRDTEAQTGALLQSRGEKKAELEELQESYTDLLSRHSPELKAVEVDIYRWSAMLEQARRENSRMRLCFPKMTEEIRTRRGEVERYQREAQEFNLQTETLLTNLPAEWKKDNSVVEKAERRDGKLLAAMDLELIQLSCRKQQLMKIGSMLHLLMIEFSKRLGVQATERPPS